MGRLVTGDILFLDFETRSDIDLRKCGVERYAESPRTDAVCLAWAFNDEPAEGVQLLNTGKLPPRRVLDHIAAGGEVVAHNARFELTMWRMLHRRQPDVWPDLKPEQLRCTMAMGRALALPGGLGDLCKALRLPIEKDYAGHALMLRLCKPRKPRKGEAVDVLLWHGTNEEFERQLAYCIQDVDAERAIYKALPRLSEYEQSLWVLDQHINDRGITIDRDAVLACKAAAKVEKDRLTAELVRLTQREVMSAQSQTLRVWLARNGLDLPDLRKDTIERALKIAPKHPNPPYDLHPVRRALEIRQLNSKSSIAKLDAAALGLCADGTLKGTLMFGTASTRRWSGARFQPHNMVRTEKGFKVADAEEVFLCLSVPGGDALVRMQYRSVTEAVANALRSTIKARDGHTLIAADYSNIEGRVLAWKAGEAWKLQAFREFDAGIGPDLYRLAASKTFGIRLADVDDFWRQIGKIIELALGFGGGHGAFISMAKNYSVNLDDLASAVKSVTPEHVWAAALWKYQDGALEEASEILAARRVEAALSEFTGEELEDDRSELETLRDELARKNRLGLSPDVWCAIRVVVDGWRTAHTATTEYWRALNAAAIAAVANPGAIFSAGDRIKFAKSGDYLLCRLPGGGHLGYPYPRIATEGSGNHQRSKLIYEGVDNRTRKWGTHSVYGGLLAENVTQGTARDVLADALLSLDRHGYRTVLHVHDEIVTENVVGFGSLAEQCTIMNTASSWTDGLPLAVAGWCDLRYRKG